MNEKLKRLKELNDEGHRLFEAYQTAFNKLNPSTKITTDEMMTIEMVQKEQKKIVEERKKIKEEMKELCEHMDILLVGIHNALQEAFKGKHTEVYWSSFQYLIEPFTPKYYYNHPKLDFNLTSVLAVGEWEKIEKALTFLIEWYCE